MVVIYLSVNFKRGVALRAQTTLSFLEKVKNVYLFLMSSGLRGCLYEINCGFSPAISDDVTHQLIL